MFYSILLPIHVLLTMTGYSGLIAMNVWLLLLCRTGESATTARGILTWRATARIFGPLLGLGVLVGFANAIVMGFSLLSPWLIATYALIVAVLAGHAALLVPLNVRAQQLNAGEAVSTRPIALAISLLTAGYLCITALMFVQP